MIGRKKTKDEAYAVEPKGFDDYELRLGDMMRGERATLGKSLLDVQRELRIKASYISAIENCDPDAFDTPGFIAGYVRSYARYLDMDPDRVFAAFCEESGFAVMHGMSAEASVVKKASVEDRLNAPSQGADIFSAPKTPFIPAGDGFWSRIEPGAVGSSLVLVGLISALTFGGWTVLQEVQRVQVTPVDQTPLVLSEVDTLGQDGLGSGGAASTSHDAIDRLYRPQALDVPVLVARDAPIASINPGELGNFATLEADRLPSFTSAIDAEASSPQVLELPAEGVRIIAAYTSWVRVRSAEGTVLFESVMAPGDMFDVPEMEISPTLHAGESGAIYFAMGADCFGPVGAPGEFAMDVPLDRLALAEKLDVVSPQEGGVSDVRRFADLNLTDTSKLALDPCQIKP